ncbi:MAG: class II aldolase/adducin family protein [Deltaproteobacteria bacterium]|nr:class II aldolase/adducin family protein [Deltaproteobacteria bacterium]
MDELIKKYTQKLIAAGYAEAGAPLMGAVDADLVWNRDDPARSLLEKVFAGLSIESLLFCRPAEPYRTVVDFLAEAADGAIFPEDTETRTFFHDLPVAPAFAAQEIVAALKERKCVIVPGQGVVTFGTVSPEQAFITFCSVCFAAFVKFFSDFLAKARQGQVEPGREAAFRRAVAHLDPPAAAMIPLRKGPFCDEGAVLGAIEEAGRATVAGRLVDSYFGNISLLSGKLLYISETGSSLDELEGYIDAVPLDGSSCAGITASSEFSAHRQIVLYTGKHTVLHGHPRFSVILSLDCERRECPERGFCHLRCPEERSVCGIPVVPGEIGTGRYGLCRTVPPALQENPGAIVHGHGVFTAGGEDFNGAFGALLGIENACRHEYFRRIGSLT